MVYLYQLSASVRILHNLIILQVQHQLIKQKYMQQRIYLPNDHLQQYLLLVFKLTFHPYFILVLFNQILILIIQPLVYQQTIQIFYVIMGISTNI